jgi:hypothetical protein
MKINFKPHVQHARRVYALHLLVHVAANDLYSLSKDDHGSLKRAYEDSPD